MEMTRLSVLALGLVLLSTIGFGQNGKTANSPFTLTWSEGKCLGCKIAARLGEIQFVSRSEVWAVGSEDHPGGVNVVVVHIAPMPATPGEKCPRANSTPTQTHGLPSRSWTRRAAGSHRGETSRAIQR